MFEKTKRLFYLTLGHFFLVLGIVGPIPFIFLASACYAKRSQRFHSLLRNNRFVGSAIANWEDRRSISLRAKLIAVGSLTVSTISVVIFLSIPWLETGICIVAVLVTCFILTRTTAR